ncbi:PP2C family protein-serine/threonine phosphatase [Streptomyces sp. T-3]|nr:PP2C family protein-serine/threonine phosphatase [Streptomyces sp. T-3]
MTRRDGGRRNGWEGAWLPGAPPAAWLRVLPFVLLITLSVLQLLTPKDIEVSFLLAATPPLAALSYRPVLTAVFGAAVILLLSVPDMSWNHPGNGDLLTIGFVVALSVVISWVRTRRDAQLVTVRTVAEAAQLAVLPPLPERVGQVRCAGLYQAAQRDALVGGDLYDVQHGPYGVRALVGDVQGHGLEAVGTVAALLGAFREGALDDPDLEAVAARLDRRLVIDSSSVEHAEMFATALLFEFPPDARVVRVVSCGHPPPLLFQAGAAAELAVQPGEPLGLGLAGCAAPEVLTVGLGPADLLLAYTDGVIEARDGAGTYYPLDERVAGMPTGEPAALIEAVWSDLARFAPELKDDVALLVLALEGPSRD